MVDDRLNLPKVEVARSTSIKASVVIASLLGCTLYLGALLIAAPFVKLQDLLTPSLVHLIFCIYSFFVCGRKIINASSIFSYGSLVFVAFPAVYGSLGLFDSPKNYSPSSVAIALSIAFCTQVVLVLFANRFREKCAHSVLEKNNFQLSTFLSPRLNWIAIALMFGALSSQLSGLGILAGALSWIAMLLSAFVGFLGQGLKLRIVSFLILGTVFLIQYGVDLGGFGRLNLAVLVFSVLLIASLGLQSWLVKFVAIAATGPALVFLANQRVEFLQATRGSSVSELEGIGSVVGPFYSSATIIEALQQDVIGLSWGATLFAAAVIWIPRSVWPDKPVGFGREIVEVTQPWLLSTTEHSDAGTFIGEAVWNFGVWGCIVYILGLIIFVSYLDKLILKANQSLSSFREIFIFLVAVILGSGLLNIVWGGAFTAMARELAPIGVLLFFSIFADKNPIPVKPSARRLKLEPSRK